MYTFQRQKRGHRQYLSIQQEFQQDLQNRLKRIQQAFRLYIYRWIFERIQKRNRHKIESRKHMVDDGYNNHVKIMTVLRTFMYAY